MRQRKFTSDGLYEIVTLRVDREIADGFKAVCHGKGAEIFAVIRYFLDESVKRNTFEWLPPDGSAPDKGYMPYALIAEMIESAGWQPPRRGRPPKKPRPMMSLRA